MNRRVLYGILALIGVVVVVGVGVLAYIYISGGSGEASEPISAPELSKEEDTQATVFRIVPAESEVRFILDEVLRGQPTTVVGKTDQVAGDILIDPDEPADAQVGTIRVNARTLATDNEFRNRAIRSRILMSAQDQYEFAEFVPTAVEGLPESVTMGEPVTFQITGDLTVRDVTNTVTFQVTVTPVSETRIEGSAATTIMRADYALNIPQAPGVANVSEEVRLEIDFGATAVE